MANISSGLVQGIPVSTNLSASSLNDTSGTRMPIASVTTGMLVLLALLVLASLFSELPKAVLAEISIEVIVTGIISMKLR